MIIRLLTFILLNILANTTFSQTTPIALGSQREIFVDNFLLDKLDGTQIVLHTPHNEGIVLKFDKPWEGSFCGYCTIIKEGELFRAYYRGIPQSGSDGNTKEVTCYAESKDGIHWEKPNVKIYTIDGSLDNNVILANSAPATHNFSPFLDSNPNVKPGQKYKALGGTQKSGLIAFVSADGIHWKRLQDSGVFKKGLFDSQNVSFWSESEGKYLCYFRTWSGEGYKGFRSVSRTTSSDFINWSEPVHMSFGDTPNEHLYTQQTSAYFRAPQIYLAIGARFMPDRQVVSDDMAKKLNVDPKYYKDCSDAYFMSSRGGSTYNRTFMESFIRPAIGLENWVSRSNYPALNVIQTSPTEMSVYVNENYAQPTANLKRYTLRLDGFTSINAPFKGGEVITKPFTFTGKELELNYSTSAAGEIRVEIQDEKGKPIPGFTMKESQTIIGNEIMRIVSWNGNENISALASKPIRLHIYMKDADLYSLKFK
ncbi:MAG: hypothetical protein ABIN89_13280 [Chitinophagaceae bacterium]